MDEGWRIVIMYYDTFWDMWEHFGSHKKSSLFFKICANLRLLQLAVRVFIVDSGLLPNLFNFSSMIVAGMLGHTFEIIIRLAELMSRRIFNEKLLILIFECVLIKLSIICFVEKKIQNLSFTLR